MKFIFVYSELIENDSFECRTYLETDYPCCEPIPTGPKNMKTTLKLSSRFVERDNHCDIYNGIDDYKNPWDIFVSWQLKSAGEINNEKK